jgi:indole-3-glycerol phosphate synthase
MNVSLGEIIEQKRQSVEHKKKKIPQSKLIELLAKVGPARDFASAISKQDRINIIGEIKRASPSAGIIRKGFGVSDIAAELAEGGASAVSVLTEEKYFQGDLYNLISVWQSVDLPILRKDFILDEYQIYESRVHNADAILLIVSLLSEEQLKQYLSLCKELTLAALVEVHSEEDLKRALNVDAGIIGINNRNLNDFSVDVNRVFKLRRLIPEDKIVVCESGIKTNQQIIKLEESRVDAVLIGETLMRSSDIAGKLRELLRR